MKIFTQVLAELSNDSASVDSVLLSFDERKRGRLKITTRLGESAGIQIERGQVLRDGSLLSNQAGDLLRVQASGEHVSTAYIQDATLFARGCYHLGNRHVSLQIGEGFLRFQTDYVLDDMLRGLGIKVIHETASFEPENGAYSNGNSHDKKASNEHQHAHDHNHDVRELETNHDHAH